MRLLKRNVYECEGRFDYYAYVGEGSDLNEDGFHTGFPEPVYAPPVQYEGNISSPTGSVSQAFDGLQIRYSHVLLMDDVNADINEHGYIVWRGKEYDIKAVVPSPNVLSIALRERIKDFGDQLIEPEEVSEESDESEGDT